MKILQQKIHNKISKSYKICSSNNITTLSTLIRIKVNNITTQFCKYLCFKSSSYRLVLDSLLAVVSATIWQRGFINRKIFRIWSELKTVVYSNIVKRHSFGKLATFINFHVIAQIKDRQQLFKMIPDIALDIAVFSTLEGFLKIHFSTMPVATAFQQEHGKKEVHFIGNSDKIVFSFIPLGYKFVIPQ